MSKKPDTKPLRVKIPIYPGYLYVCYTDSILSHGRSIGVEYSLDIDDCLAVASKRMINGALHHTILMKHTQFENYGTIAHEALHVVNHIFKDVGIVANQDEDEHTAYLLSWIVEQIQKYNGKIKADRHKGVIKLIQPIG
jgi:hypothetical protein